MAVSPNGKRLVSASSDAVKVWETESGAAKGFKGPFGSSFTAVGISGDGQRLAVGNEDSTIRLLDVGQLEAWKMGPQPAAGGAEPKPGQPGPAKPLKKEDQIWD